LTSSRLAYVRRGVFSGRASVALDRQEQTDAVIARAKELAAQGRHPQTIEVLLRMEGFLDASDFISHDLANELKQVAERARKERDGPRF
jgi:cytochrome c1